MTWPRQLIEFAMVFVAGLVLTATLLVGAIAYLSHRSPRPHDNASFRYGRRIMDAQIYGDDHVTSIGAACRAALAHPADPPRHFDVDQAVAGCLYQEHWEDS